MKRLVWIGMFGLLWVMAACGDDDVKVIPVASVPTIIPTPSEVVPLVPTQRPSIISRPSATSTQLPPSTTPTRRPSMTPVQLGSVVIAVRPIPAGAAIPPDAVQSVSWPVDTLPYMPIDDVSLVINEVALVDIGCNEPILPDAIAYREVGSGFDDLPDTCPDIAEDVETVDVVIAVADLPPGSTIEPGEVTLRPWPVGALPPGHHQAIVEVIGMVTTREIRREQPITSRRIESD